MRLIFTCLLAAATYLLAQTAPANARSPEMDLIVDVIINDDFTVRVGNTYVMVLDHVEHRTMLKYDPGTEDTDESLTLIDEAALIDRSTGARSATCRTEVTDVGLIGDVGPRDGFTRCEGVLGASSIFGPQRSRMYRALIADLLRSVPGGMFMLIIPETKDEVSAPGDRI